MGNFLLQFEICFESRDPVFVVMRTEGVDAEGFGNCAVVGAVVDEEGLIGCGLLTFEHHAENLWRGLHHLALVTQVEAVEIIVDGMMAAIERWGAGPLHHKGIGV